MWCSGRYVVLTTRSFSDSLTMLKVLEGMDVVKKVEAMGSGSGTPSKTVKIADCGELPVAADE